LANACSAVGDTPILQIKSAFLQIRLIMPPHYDVEVLRDIKRSRQGRNRGIYFRVFIVFVFNCVFIYVMLFSRIWHIKCSLIQFK
jgi:hypothetical protein